jgi:hypothetical protein
MGRVRQEAMIGLGCYVAMLAVRAVVLRRGGRLQARRNAQRIAVLERRLGVHVEPALQRRLLRFRRFVPGVNVFYVVANIVITIGWLVRLLVRSDPDYPVVRRAVVGSTLVAQAVFLVIPTAPPRSLDHIVDSMLEHSGVDLDGRWISRLYNPLAAIPSLHMAFAVVTAASAIGHVGRPELQAAFAAYPPTVAVIVIATGNHYVADVVTGSLLGAGALWWSNACQGSG